MDKSSDYPKETPKVLHSTDKGDSLSRKKGRKKKGPKGNPWWPWF